MCIFMHMDKLCIMGIYKLIIFVKLVICVSYKYIYLHHWKNRANIIITQNY